MLPPFRLMVPPLPFPADVTLIAEASTVTIELGASENSGGGATIAATGARIGRQADVAGSGSDIERVSCCIRHSDLSTISSARAVGNQGESLDTTICPGNVGTTERDLSTYTVCSRAPLTSNAFSTDDL